MQVFHPHINMWHLVVIHIQLRQNFSNTQSLSSNCVNLFLRRVLSENDVCVGAGTVNDEHQIFPIFLADTTTYILLRGSTIFTSNYCSRQFLWLRDQLADLFYLTLASHIIARAVATYDKYNIVIVPSCY